MTNGFAIAALNHVLREVIGAFIRGSGDATEIGPFRMTSRSPALLAIAPPSQTILTVFPWRVERIGRNSHSPSRLAPPATLYLDVTYLVAAFAEVEDVAEILTGLAGLALSETAVPGDQLIREAASGAFPANSPLPLAIRNLADQVETISLRPIELSLIESLQFWSALGCGLRLGQHFVAGPLMMQVPSTGGRPLPVLTRSR